jgi:hypothetical protein
MLCSTHSIQKSLRDAHVLFPFIQETNKQRTTQTNKSPQPIKSNVTSFFLLVLHSTTSHFRIFDEIHSYCVRYYSTVQCVVLYCTACDYHCTKKFKKKKNSLFSSVLPMFLILAKRYSTVTVAHTVSLC